MCAPLRYLLTRTYYRNFPFASRRGVSTIPEGDTKIIKVGLIGVGKVGRVGGTTVTLLNRGKKYHIVAVSDTDLDLAKRFA